jgi:hypothetical protein
VIELVLENVENLCRGFREVLEILEVLHHLDLSSESVTMVLDSQAYDLVDSQPDLLRFHVPVIFGHIVCRTCHAATDKVRRRRCSVRRAYEMKVSRSAVLVHNRAVFSFRTRVKRANVAGI